MKIQALLVILAVAALTTTGCCNLRNVLFGRGASCGPCASAAPALNIAPPAMAAPCGDGCGQQVMPYAGEPTCGYEGSTSYAPAFDDGYSYDGGIIGNGVPYPQGMPMGGGGNWAPRNEYTVPGSTFYSEGAAGPTLAPRTNMGAVSAQ